MQSFETICFYLVALFSFLDNSLCTPAAYLLSFPTTFLTLGMLGDLIFHLLLECERFPVSTFLLNPKIYKYKYIFYKDQSDIKEIHVSSFKKIETHC